LAGQADIGWSNRIGWYEGLHLLTSMTPTGVITGFGFAAGSCHDHPLAETFFAARQHPSPRLKSVGAPAQGVYVEDLGFAGDQLHRHWQACNSAEVVSPPHQRSKGRWSKPWRRWLGCVRSLRPSMTSCSIPSGWGVRAPMPWMAFKHAWLRKLLCITFASGSTCRWAANHWLSPTCSTGKFVISIHTKRLSISVSS